MALKTPKPRWKWYTVIQNFYEQKKGGATSILFVTNYASLSPTWTIGILYVVEQDETHGWLSSNYYWNGIWYVYIGWAGTVDDMVRADNTDPISGYLDAKVDWDTIDVDATNHVLILANLITDWTVITNITDPLNWTWDIYTGPTTGLVANQYYYDGVFHYQFDGTTLYRIDQWLATYINAWVNNIAVWGLDANQWPFNTTVQGMLDRILYPFVQMTTLLSTSPTWNSIYERGVDIAPITLTATTARSMNPTYPITTTVFKRAGSTIDTQLWDTTPLSFIETNTVDNTVIFSEEVTNTQLYTATSSRTFTFVYPMYGWHSQAGDYLGWTDLASIEAVLTEKRVLVQSNQTITDTFTTARNIFIYPASYPVLTSILDVNGFETISNYDVYTQSYTTRDSVSTLYRIYQLKNDTSQSLFSNTYKF